MRTLLCAALVLAGCAPGDKSRQQLSIRELSHPRARQLAEVLHQGISRRGRHGCHPRKGLRWFHYIVPRRSQTAVVFGKNWGGSDSLDARCPRESARDRLNVPGPGAA